VNVLDVVEGPRLTVDAVRAAQYDALLDGVRGTGGPISYDVAHPKHEFLSYAVHHRGLLAHGSNRAGIEEFEPRPADEGGTRQVGVFAADDAIRPMGFATVSRARRPWGQYNGFYRTGRGEALRRFYVFAIARDPDDPTSWTDGAVYLLPRDTFAHGDADEWISVVAVRPVAWLPVSPDDFPFRRATVRFAASDPPWRIRRRFRDRARALAPP